MSQDLAQTECYITTLRSYTASMNGAPKLTGFLPEGEHSLVAILLTGTVQAGFPSPADDLGAERIDLAKVLILVFSFGHKINERSIFI